MKTSAILSTLVLGAALTLPVFDVAAEANPTSIEKLITEMAVTPEQHLALAQYYEDKIVETKKDLALHTKMRKAYKGGGHDKTQTAMAGMSKHCDKLISNAESNIKEYEAMAAEHKAVAVKKP